MSDDYAFTPGHAPLVVSIPHDGRDVPDAIAARMSEVGRALPDTDWHVRRLYGFATTLGASVLAARWSRYVVDLNRPADDAALYPGQVSTGICPARTFGNEAIYADGGTVDAGERATRIERYWRPYHERLRRELEAVRERHGYALLWDAHSIRSEVPALFDGELPVLNVGTWDGRSCAATIEDALWAVASLAPYSAVRNGRFTGGYTTRHYGRPAHGVHAVQLELAQRAYMDERTLRYDEPRGRALADTLRALLRAYLESAHALYA